MCACVKSRTRGTQGKGKAKGRRQDIRILPSPLLFLFSFLSFRDRVLLGKSCVALFCIGNGKGGGGNVVLYCMLPARRRIHGRSLAEDLSFLVPGTLTVRMLDVLCVQYGKPPCVFLVFKEVNPSITPPPPPLGVSARKPMYSALLQDLFSLTKKKKKG